MAGCRAPALQVCIPGGLWCILVVGGASLVAGGVILDGWWCDPRWLVVHLWWLVVPPWWLVVPPWWLVV